MHTLNSFEQKIVSEMLKLQSENQMITLNNIFEITDINFYLTIGPSSLEVFNNINPVDIKTPAVLQIANNKANTQIVELMDLLNILINERYIFPITLNQGGITNILGNGTGGYKFSIIDIEIVNHYSRLASYRYIPSQKLTDLCKNHYQTPERIAEIRSISYQRITIGIAFAALILSSIFSYMGYHIQNTEAKKKEPKNVSISQLELVDQHLVQIVTMLDSLATNNHKDTHNTINQKLK